MCVCARACARKLVRVLARMRMCAHAAANAFACVRARGRTLDRAVSPPLVPSVPLPTYLADGGRPFRPPIPPRSKRRGKPGKGLLPSAFVGPRDSERSLGVLPAAQASPAPPPPPPPPAALPSPHPPGEPGLGAQRPLGGSSSPPSAGGIADAIPRSSPPAGARSPRDSRDSDSGSGPAERLARARSKGQPAGPA